MTLPDVSSLKSILASSQATALLLPQNPAYDAVSSALSLKLCLEQAGKSAIIACADPMTVEFNRLVGVDSITRFFGSRNLVISFPDQTELVDKVSYNVEAGELQLVVTPKPGAGLDHRRLKFVSSASQADLVILIDVGRLADLGPLYHEGKDFLHSARLVSLTRQTPDEDFTPHQFHFSEALSIVELTLHLIDSLNLPLSSDAASNLFAGLERATHNFQHPAISAITFDTAAKLLRKGAKRHSALSASDFPQGAIPQAPPQVTGTAEAVAETKPPTPPPSDWLAPKVYRGPMLQ